MTSTVSPPCAPDPLNQHLSALVIEARRHPHGSLQRQQSLTQLISLIQQSGKLWNDHTSEMDDYNEALQQTWLYLCQSLDRYDPEKASLITWLNSYLKYRLMDRRLAHHRDRRRLCSGQLSADGEWFDPIEQIPSPDPPPTLLDDIQTWLQHNAPLLKRKHLPRHPQITCYVLICHRLPPETSWRELSQTFGVPISTLSNFYQRECLPRLRDCVEQHRS
jgi:hypothetical protein